MECMSLHLAAGRCQESERLLSPNNVQEDLSHEIALTAKVVFFDQWLLIIILRQ